MTQPTSLPGDPSSQAAGGIPIADYDSAWKQILETYFEQFLAFFLPAAHAAIDWGQGYRLLDKELQQIMPDAELGQRRVDMLLEVALKDGTPVWVLIHIEVQGQPQPDFDERMYVYNYRLYDRHHTRVASVAVLTDDVPGWRPGSFSYELFDCRVRLDFPVIKLLDYREKWAALEADSNPFAVVVMAHLKTVETRGNAQERYAAKMTLARMLYRRGYGREDILALFRFLDWIMTLPADLDIQFRTDLEQFETEVDMTYVTSVERLAMKEGLEQGREEGLEQGIRESILNSLVARFDAAPAEVQATLEKVKDLERLRALHRESVVAPTLEAFRDRLAEVESDLS